MINDEEDAALWLLWRSDSGDFAGASGVLKFKDDVTNGTSFYRGPVKP